MAGTISKARHTLNTGLGGAGMSSERPQYLTIVAVCTFWWRNLGRVAFLGLVEFVGSLILITLCVPVILMTVPIDKKPILAGETARPDQSL